MENKQSPHMTGSREHHNSSKTEHTASTASHTTQDLSLVHLSQEQYVAQFKQMDKEALATIIAAVVITLVFWGTIFLFHDIKLNILHMPLWFVLSCIGGYLFSIVVVLVLVKKFMRNLELKVERFAPQKLSTSALDTSRHSQQE